MCAEDGTGGRQRGRGPDLRADPAASPQTTTVAGAPSARGTTSPMRYTVSPAACEQALRLVGVFGTDDDDHADAAVEDAVHLGVGDVAVPLQPVRTARAAASASRSQPRARRVPGSTRGMFSTSPPPVMCAMPLTGSAAISASSGFT